MTTLAEVLKKVAMGCEIAGNVAMLELKNSPPEDALKFLTPTSAGGGGAARDNSDLAKSFKNFMRYFVTLGAAGKSPLTGSCGQTSQWLDRITSKGAVETAMVKAPTAAILSELAAVTQSRWYCRLSTGNHSFLIEHADGRYCVYQSFHGSQSIEYSVSNIVNGRCVFEDKKQFFDLLGGAVLDPQSYQTLRQDQAAEKAISDARKQGIFLTRGRVDDLYDAMNKYPAPSALWNDATAAEKKFVAAYDLEMGEIVDSIIESGSSQTRVFHGAIWTPEDPSQYRLNTDPATASEIATNIALGIQRNRDKWATCFQDTKGTTKARLRKLGIAL